MPLCLGQHGQIRPAALGRGHPGFGLPKSNVPRPALASGGTRAQPLTEKLLLDAEAIELRAGAGGAIGRGVLPVLKRCRQAGVLQAVPLVFTAGAVCTT